MDLPFEGEKGPETRAGAVADRDPATCGLDDPVGAVSVPCVVVSDEIVLGVVEADAEPDKTATEAMEPGPSTFRPSIPQDELASWLDDHDRDSALLTTLDGRLVGLVRRSELNT
jgi:hypothetical protein